MAQGAKAHAGKYAYGLGKLENLAEFLIALLQTIIRILRPEGVEGAEFGLFVTAAAAIGNVILNRKATRLARSTRSPVLAAQARVHLVSAISSGMVFTVTTHEGQVCGRQSISRAPNGFVLSQSMRVADYRN